MTIRSHCTSESHVGVLQSEAKNLLFQTTSLNSEQQGQHLGHLHKAAAVLHLEWRQISGHREEPL